MRPSLVTILAAATAAGSVFDSPAIGQSAATDPVGFITLNAGSAAAGTPKVSLISPTLVQPVEWQGAISTIAGTTITVAGTPWLAGQFGTNGQYYVEVASGANAGAWTDIESSTTNSLVTQDDLSAFATGGANPSSIRIRKHSTLNSFLGATNSAGLQGGETLVDADEVVVYDGAAPSTYFYYTGNAVPQGWVDGAFNPRGNVVIAPHQGVVIKRKGTSPLSFVALGAVKTGNTYFPINSGINVLGTVAAKGLTLGTSGLFTGNPATGIQGSSSDQTGADEVVIYTSGTPTAYWYYTGTGLPAGWYDSNYTNATNVPIAPGSSLVIKRKAPGGAFNWPVPSPTSF